MRRLLKALIEGHAGWHICGETADGYEAVAKATELKPDLVLLDFAMPRLNGLQIAAEISSACPSLPMILHTVHIFPAIISEAKKVGIREVVGKGLVTEFERSQNAFRCTRLDLHPAIDSETLVFPLIAGSHETWKTIIEALRLISVHQFSLPQQ